MDWKLAIEVERAALERIALLLFAIADLAERASRRSLPVRGFVLWILLPAETVARNLLTGLSEPICDCPAGKSPEDAMRLASSLRTLAAAFRDLSRWMLCCANDTGGLSRKRTGVSISGTAPVEASSMVPCALRWTPHDTS